MRQVLVVILCGLVAACTPRGEILLYPQAEGVGSTQTVFVGTTRGPDPEAGEDFGRIRSPETRYARYLVSVPPEREAGEVLWPRPRRAPDPLREFVTLRGDLFADAPVFRAELAHAFRTKPRGQREATVFVHGFNTTFAEGIYRIAQLGEDLALPGVLVHYAWPSRAAPLAYAYDRDSSLFARDGLEDLLEQVAAAGAERIVLVAHSMGAALAMETLRQMAIGGDRNVRPRLGGVVLISPDLDVDLFRAQAARIGTLPQPFLIFTSQKDRALGLAARLSGERARLGNLQDVAVLADLKVTVVEVGAFSTGTGHFTPGTSPALLQLLGRLPLVDAAFALDRAGRTGLLEGVVLTVQDATQIILAPVGAIGALAQEIGG